MVEKNVFLYLHSYLTRGIDCHYHSYVIEPTLDKKVVYLSNKNEVLPMLHPLLTHSLRSEPGRSYIVTKCIVVKNLSSCILHLFQQSLCHPFSYYFVLLLLIINNQYPL